VNIDEATASIQQATARLRKHTLRSMLAIEPVALPAWRPRKPRAPKKTQTMRSNHGQAEIDLLQRILEAPADPDLAMQQWRTRHEAHKLAFRAGKVARSR
jgi:hypothetical protein